MRIEKLHVRQDRGWQAQRDVYDAVHVIVAQMHSHLQLPFAILICLEQAQVVLSEENVRSPVTLTK